MDGISFVLIDYRIDFDAWIVIVLERDIGKLGNAIEYIFIDSGFDIETDKATSHNVDVRELFWCSNTLRLLNRLMKHHL